MTAELASPWCRPSWALHQELAGSDPAGPICTKKTVLLWSAMVPSDRRLTGLGGARVLRTFGQRFRVHLAAYLRAEILRAIGGGSLSDGVAVACFSWRRSMEFSNLWVVILSLERLLLLTHPSRKTKRFSPR